MTTVPRAHTGAAATDRGRWWVLALFVVGCQLAGLIGVPFNDRGAQSWYDRLDKPWFTPPSAVFAPVWTVLYLLMAVAAWLVWRSDHRLRRPALVLFATQLVLNAIWSPLFFGAQRPGWALAEIGLLWLAVAATTVRFWSIEATAGALLVPYLAWVSYAAALNTAIVVLN